MFATQSAIDTLADRIERAYLLRRPHWNPGCSASRVWAAAATTLLQAGRDHPWVPLDPELFVAAQAVAGTLVDPWTELTQASAGRRYCWLIRRSISSLRDELRGEVRLAERRVKRGESVASVVLSRSPSLSPLGRFIVAVRARRDDLAGRLRPEVVDQHRMCPLYRAACVPMLAPESYPVPAAGPDGGDLAVEPGFSRN